MKMRILTTVSVLALATSTAAFADTKESNRIPEVPTVTEEDIKEGWKETKETAANVAERITEAAKDASDKFKALLVEEKEPPFMMINHKITANGMIGQSVQDTEGNTIAKVHDLIINEDGEATRIVLSEGGIMGLGDKLVGLSYDTMVHRDASGDLIIPVTKEGLEKAPPYSADGDSSMPKYGQSVRDILEGKLIDQERNVLAEIDNITFINGEAAHLILAFDQTYGFGGELAAIPFDRADAVRGTERVDFQVTALQAKSFRDFKREAVN